MDDSTKLCGRAWVFGDDIDTDVLAPGTYLKESIEVLSAHCLEAVSPDFAQAVQPGDIVVGGRNFGIGSSREQAAQALKTLGVSAIIAISFAGIFYRNSLNIGLPALICHDVRQISDGDQICVDPARGRLDNISQGSRYPCDPLPDHLLAMIADGGLIAHLEKRLKADRSRKGPSQ